MQLHTFVFGRAEVDARRRRPVRRTRWNKCLPCRGDRSSSRPLPENLRGLPAGGGDGKVHADLAEGWTQVGVFKKQHDGFYRLTMKGGAADGGAAEVGFYFDRVVYRGKPPLKESLAPGEKQKATLKVQIKIAQFG